MEKSVSESWEKEKPMEVLVTSVSEVSHAMNENPSFSVEFLFTSKKQTIETLEEAFEQVFSEKGEVENHEKKQKNYN